MQNLNKTVETKDYVDVRKKVAFKMFNRIAKTYDAINLILSLGIDYYWRKELLKRIPKRPHLKILDLATGTGKIALKLGENPNIDQITAVDLSSEMIQVAKNRYAKINSSKKRKLRPIEFIVADGVNFNNGSKQYDIATIGFGIRNMYDPKKTLVNLYDMLNENGKILILELSIPQNSFFKKTFLCYFRYILPKLGGFISRNIEAYTYLNESVEIFPSGEDFATLLKSCGFSEIKTFPLTFGIANIYEGKK